MFVFADVHHMRRANRTRLLFSRANPATSGLQTRPRTSTIIDLHLPAAAPVPPAEEQPRDIPATASTAVDGPAPDLPTETPGSDANNGGDVVSSSDANNGGSAPTPAPASKAAPKTAAKPTKNTKAASHAPPATKRKPRRKGPARPPRANSPAPNSTGRTAPRRPMRTTTDPSAGAPP